MALKWHVILPPAADHSPLMSPDIGQAWFRIAIFITFVSAVLIPFEPRDSAEFVISVASFVVGLVFIAIVVFFTRRSIH